MDSVLIVLLILVCVAVVLGVVNLARAGAERRETRRELSDVVARSNQGMAQIIQGSSETTLQLIQGSSEANRTALAAFGESHAKGIAEMQNAIRDKVDERLDAIQRANENKLEEMRKTVDEKLEATLSARLKTSFDTVNAQLDNMNLRLGEMNKVAETVTALNKTLSGSKTRGILGELQLAQIIEDMLPSQLYEREVQLKRGSADRVEFAVKMPGAEEGGFVYLPIDSKFPLDDYYRLVEGYDAGDLAAVDTARKALLARVKQFGREVRDKYINPPRTTNFAVVFLPTEGLYAEAVRDASFFEELRKQGIMLAGPATLSALLSSLLMGFKTLQIQKGAVEIQKTLERAKKEFESFGSVLGKAQDRIRQTGEELDKLVGVRTDRINSALKNVQVFSYEEVGALPEEGAESPGEDVSPF
jgi:DNA recombination protein RmuC